MKGSLSILDNILAAHGIVNVPGIGPLPNIEDSYSSSGSAGDTRDTMTLESDSGKASSSDAKSLGESEDSSNEEIDDYSDRASSSNRSLQSPTVLESIVIGSQTMVSSGAPSPRFMSAGPDQAYIKLLNDVILAAQNIDMPAVGTAERVLPGVLSGAVAPAESIFGDRALNSLAHDRKVGAAGELFVCLCVYLKLAMADCFQRYTSCSLPGPCLVSAWTIGRVQFGIKYQFTIHIVVCLHGRVLKQPIWCTRTLRAN